MTTQPVRDLYEEYTSIRIDIPQGITLMEASEQLLRFYFVYAALRNMAETASYEQLGNAADAALLRSKLDGSANVGNLNKLHDKGKGILKSLEGRFSSLYFILDGAFSNDSKIIQTFPIQRLLILAILTRRLTMLPTIVKTFTNLVNPVALQRILRPYVDPAVDLYKDEYLLQKTDKFDVPLEQLFNNTLIELGKVRINQNIMIRNLIRVRYLLLQCIASPHLFTPASLAGVNRLLTEVRIVLKGDDTREFTPLNDILNTTAINYDRVSAILEVGNAITRESVRRLDALLTIVRKTDKILDSSSSATGVENDMPTVEVATQPITKLVFKPSSAPIRRTPFSQIATLYVR